MTGLQSGALLICGSGTGAGIGCGKTSLAHAVCQQLKQWPICAYVILVDCIPFRGSKLFPFVCCSNSICNSWSWDMLFKNTLNRFCTRNGKNFLII